MPTTFFDYGTEADWLTAKAQAFTSTESPALYGVHSHKTPYSLFWLKRHGVLSFGADTEPSDVQMRGIFLEPGVREWGAKKYRAKIRPAPHFALWYDKDLPPMATSLDAFAEWPDLFGGAESICEIKTISGFRTFDPASPPLQWQVQVQHQMSVTGYRHAVLLVLQDSTLHRCVIDRDDVFIDDLRERVREFVRRVTRNRPPEPGPSRIDANIIAKIHPEDAQTWLDGIPADDWIDARERISGILRAAHRCKDEIDNRLKAAIGDHTFARTPAGRILSLKTREVPEHVRRASKSRVLTVHKKGKDLPHGFARIDGSTSGDEALRALAETSALDGLLEFTPGAPSRQNAGRDGGELCADRDASEDLAT